MVLAGLFLSVVNPPIVGKTEKYRWRNVAVVAGGFISGITYHPKQKGLAYCRTDIGGAYRWNDRQSQWVPLLDWLPKADWNLYGIEALAIDPTDPNRLFLACGTYTNSWGTNGAILASSDQGRTFSRSPLPFKLGGNEDGRSMGERLAVDPLDGKTLFFGTRNQGLWQSKDRGDHWTQSQTFPVTERTNGIGLTAVAFDPRKGKGGLQRSSVFVGVASADDNLYHSEDGGTTWQAVAGSPAGMFVHHLVISRNGKLFATYSKSSGPNGVTGGAVYELDLDRKLWTDITPIKPNIGTEKGFGYAGLAIDADGTTVVTSTIDRWNPGDDVFYSTDSGASWLGLAKSSKRDSSAAPYMNWGGTTSRFGWWIGAVAFDPFQKSRVLYGTGANIWGCDNVLKANVGLDTDWTVRGKGIEETADIDLLSPPVGPPLISALGDIGGFTHTDLTRPPGGMSTNPQLSNTDSLASSASGEVIAKVGRPDGKQASGGLSLDQGTSWKPFITAPYPGATGGSVAVSADGSTILWGPNNRTLYRTVDAGASWTVVATSPARIVADPIDSNTFYGVSPARSARGMSNPSSFTRSKDGGKTFMSIPFALAGTIGQLRAMPGFVGRLYLPTASSVLVSEDGGDTFKPLPGVDAADSVGFGKGKSGSKASAIYLNGRVQGVDGVFRSDDEGQSWIKITDSTHEYATRGVVIGDPKIYGRVYLGTNGRGVLYGDPPNEH